jgi:hypothetical protein
MRRLITGIFGLALCLSVFGLSTGSASAAEAAAPLTALKGLTSEAAPVTKIDYQDYCVRQYFKCRNYSESGFEFRRCMNFKGCWEAYRAYRDHREQGGCSRWSNICADRWGQGSGDYRSCLRYHGCD